MSHAESDIENIVRSPLGIVAKSDGSSRRIHDLLYPENHSTNNSIPEDYGTLNYTTISDILVGVLRTGRHSIIIKRDIKAAFRMLAVRCQDRRLLGFTWNHTIYYKNCLLFGLRTAPYLFNLFTKGLYWILERYIASISREHLVLLYYYLDDFIFILSASASSLAISCIYNLITDHLGIPRNARKNRIGTKVEILGYVIDTVYFFISLSSTKQRNLIKKIAAFLSRPTVTYNDCVSLAGSLNFTAFIIAIGRSYSASL